MSHPHTGSRISTLVVTLAAGCLSVIAASGGAQTAPWLVLPGPGGGYVDVPHHQALDPTTAVTIEMWVYLTTGLTADGQDSPSLVGKNLNNGYWFGVVGRRLRFHYGGFTVYRDGAALIPLREWAHVAVTFDGANLRFYINGALDVAHTDVSGQIESSTAPLRIAGDAFIGRSPLGAIDEVRLWSVARTAAEIANHRGTTITQPQTGLVAVWNFAGDLNDPIGGHNGTLHGAAELGSTLPELDTCPNEYFVPAGAHNRGELESQWRTDVTLYNATGSDAQVDLFLLRRDADNSAPQQITVVAPRRRSSVLPDIVLESFGYSNVAAALRICSDQPLQVRTRTYNQSQAGTFGQGVPGPAVTHSSRSGSLIALYENPQFRTNVGFVNTTPNPTLVLLDFYNGSGALIGNRMYELKPYGHIQVGRAFQAVTGVPIDNGRIDFSTPSADVIAYASVVDNATGDGTYLTTD